MPIFRLNFPINATDEVERQLCVNKAIVSEFYNIPLALV